MPSLKQFLLSRFNTKAQDILMPNDDLRLIVNAEPDKKGGLRKVKGYKQVGDTLSAIVTTSFQSDADFNGGAFSSTEALNDTLVLTGGVIEQVEQNDSHEIHGDNWFAQSFKATGTSISKITLFLDKLLGAIFLLYDDFNDNSIDSTKWTIAVGGTSQVIETGGKLSLECDTGAANSTRAETDGKTDGNNWSGCKFNINRTSGEMQGTTTNNLLFGGILQGSEFIRFSLTKTNLVINSSSGFGSLNTSFSGNNHLCEIRPNNNNIEIYLDGSLKFTLTNKSISGFFETQNFNSSEGGGTAIMTIDNLSKYEDTTAIADLDVRIETDSSGAPSGSALSNGTTTIDDADVVEEMVTQVDAVFSTPPVTVVDVTYWIVLKQTGGDANNLYRAYKQNSEVFGNGLARQSTDGGSSWADDADAPSDLAFKIFGSYNSTGTWISSNIILLSNQTLTQIILNFKDVSAANAISQVDIVNTSDVVQSSFTTDIITGTTKTIRAADFDSGLGFTNGNTFRVKISLISGGTISPAIEAVFLDSPETSILLLAPFYQASGTRALIAFVAGTAKRLTSNTWTNIASNLTSGLPTGGAIFAASKGPKTSSGTVTSADSSSFTDTSQIPAPNAFQGDFVKIITGPGAGQVRRIQSNEGTSTSTTTSTSSSTTTTTSTSTTTSTTTTVSTSTTTTESTSTTTSAT